MNHHCENDIRYSRHILLDKLGSNGVEKIRGCKTLIVGAGGLGCPAAQYLASAGIHNIRLIDPDIVEESNLPRQILFGSNDIGIHKVDAVKRILKNKLPEINIITERTKADETNLPDFIENSDIVLDCSDKFETKQILNKVCFFKNRPLIIASAIEWTGQLQIIDSRQKNTACYACLFDPDEKVEDAPCGAYGVFSTAVGTIGLLQANEALKIASGITPSVGKMFLFDALEPSFDWVNINKRKNCPVCG